MKHPGRWILLFLSVAAALGADDARITASAGKSIALLQKVAAQWRTPCFSCHHQAMPMLALEAARAHGVPVDEAAAQAAAERAFRDLSKIDDAARIDQLIDPAMLFGYSLVAAHAAGVPASFTTALYARQLARAQQSDGHWATFDGRPPHSAGLFVSTALAARAVDLYLPGSRLAEKKERLGRARRWLASARPQSTEDLTYRLIGLVWTGTEQAELRRAARELAVQQKPDGGWAQLPSMSSDAYSTGQVLVALRRAGLLDAAVSRRGIEWLLGTQAADGSWHVKSRIKTPAPLSPPYFKSGFPYGHDQYVSCAATAWAAMALSEALPAVKRAPVRLPLRGVAAAPAPWMEIAAFGSPAEVARLDPHLATAGGTTALMFAADDPEKVRVLIKKGAKVNAVAKSGYDALMVASLFGGNRETLDVLIRAGASPKARPNVRYDAAALNVAVFTGDVEMIGVLLRAGADPNRPYRILGQFPFPPLSVVAQMDLASAIRALVAGGAKIDVADADGMTALSWSALVHKDEGLRTLLDLGANPRVKDRFGLTPLDHTKAVAGASEETARLLGGKR